jgi:hypothetical protein
VINPDERKDRLQSFMKPTKPNFRIIFLTAPVITICITGYYFLRSWHRHGTNTTVLGLLFALSVMLTAAPMLFLRRDK